MLDPPSQNKVDDLEDVGQCQRSSYVTHPLILMMICAKNGKNPSKTVDLFFKVKAENFKKFAKNSNFQMMQKRNTRHTL